MGSLCTVWAGMWSSFLKQEDFLDLSSPFIRKTDTFLDLNLLCPASSSWSTLVVREVTASFEGFCETLARVKKPWANDNGWWQFSLWMAKGPGTAVWCPEGIGDLLLYLAFFWYALNIDKFDLGSPLLQKCLLFPRTPKEVRDKKKLSKSVTCTPKTTEQWVEKLTKIAEYQKVFQSKPWYKFPCHLVYLKTNGTVHVCPVGSTH